MLQRRLLLTQQLEEIANLIIKDLHEPFGSELLFSEEELALVLAMKAIYHDPMPSIDNKISHVESMLKELAKKNKQSGSLYAYYSKWLSFLHYQKNQKQFFEALPNDEALLFMDSYLNDIDAINATFANIDEQLELIEGYVKLCELNQRNVLLQELKRGMQDVVRLSKIVHVDFFVNDAPLEAQSIQMLLSDLRNYYQQKLAAIKRNLDKSQIILGQFAQINDDMYQFSELLEDERKEKFLAFGSEDSRVVLEISQHRLKEIKEMINKLYSVFERPSIGQTSSLAVAPQAPSDLDLVSIMSADQQKLNALTRQLQESQQSFLDDVVRCQSKCFVQYDLINSKLESYEAKVLRADKAMNQTDHSSLQSTISVIPAPNTYLLESYISDLQAEKQYVGGNKSRLEESYTALGWHAEKEEKARFVPATEAHLHCYLALADLVSKSITFAEEIKVRQKNVHDSGNPDAGLDQLAPFSESLMVAINGKMSSLPSLIAFIDLVLADEAVLFGNDLLEDAMENLRLIYRTVYESVPEEKVEKEKEKEKEKKFTPAPSTAPSSSGSVLSYFWSPAPEPKKEEMSPQLQKVLAHMPTALPKNSFS